MKYYALNPLLFVHSAIVLNLHVVLTLCSSRLNSFRMYKD